ncbi:hypothetical protein [Rhodanobacter fulvus]|uniref:hypothetical protein n=1 Tax=Rhodanobacter fulvus TaxID=219571 RepID=UPI0012EAF7CE|nr:hypothetical protein [Rhodanobacter fulvus]
MQSEANNLLYGDKNNVFFDTVFSGFTNGLGYLGGDGATKFIDKKMPRSLVPSIVGNTVGPIISEGVGEVVNDPGHEIKNKEDNHIKGDK